MDKILHIADELTEAFVNCDVYREYISIKQRLDDNPELKGMLERFYKESLDFELKRLGGGEPDFEEERRISGQYADIWLSEDGRRFMEIKNALYRTLRTIYETIEEKCALQL